MIGNYYTLGVIFYFKNFLIFVNNFNRYVVFYFVKNVKHVNF